MYAALPCCASQRPRYNFSSEGLAVATVKPVAVTRVMYDLSFGSFGSSRRMLTLDGHTLSQADIHSFLKKRHPSAIWSIQSVEATFEDRF